MQSTIKKIFFVFSLTSLSFAAFSNDYYVYAKANSSTQLEFTLLFQEEAAGNPNFDEQVNGTLTSTVKFTRASGVYVDTPAPSFVTVSSL